MDKVYIYFVIAFYIDWKMDGPLLTIEHLRSLSSRPSEFLYSGWACLKAGAFSAKDSIENAWYPAYWKGVQLKITKAMEDDINYD